MGTFDTYIEQNRRFAIEFIEEALRNDWSDPVRDARGDITKAIGAVDGFRLEVQMSWKRASPAIRHGLKRCKASTLAKFAHTALVGHDAQVTLDFYRALGLPHCSVPTDLQLDQGISPTIEDFTTAWQKASSADRPRMLLCIAVVAERGLPEWRAAAADAYTKIELMGSEVNSNIVEVVEHSVPTYTVATEALPASTAISPNEQSTNTVPLPPTLPALTLLDHVFIDLIVATIDGIQGAKSVEQLRVIIEEFTQLNSGRFQSRFHRGFLAGMTQSELPSRTASENDSRRAWLLAGWLSARLRQVGDDGHVEFQKLSADDQRTLFSDQGRPAIKSIADPMVDCLAASGQAGSIPRWLPHATRMGLSHALIYARFLLRIRRPQDAKLIAIAVRDASYTGPRGGTKQSNTISVEARVVGGTAARMLGDYEFALNDLRPVLDYERELIDADEMGNASDRILRAFGDARAQALLCEARIEYVEGLWIPQNQVDPHLKQKLKPIAEQLLLHVRNRTGRASGSLTYCAALWIISSPDRADAKAATEDCIQALSEIIADIQSDATPRLTQALFPRMVVLRALMVISLGQSQIDESIEDLVEYEKHNELLPFHVVKDLIVVGLSADVERTVELIIPRVEHDLVNLLRSSLLPAAVQHPTVSAMIYEKFTLRTSYMGRRDAIRVGAEVFKASVGAGFNREHVETLADDMISIVETYSPASTVCLDAFLEDDRWQYVWQESDFTGIRARLAEYPGNESHRDSTRQWLLQRAHSLAAQDVDLAEECIHFAEWLGMPKETCDGVRKQIARFCGHSSIRAVTNGAQGVRARVLFVGGDHRQEVMQPAIRRLVSTSHPNITMQFEHPGWSSNWKAVADSVSRKLRDVDIVVLNPFVRTMFGRYIRKAISDVGKQWRTTYGHAPPSIARAIVVAADAVGTARG